MGDVRLVSLAVDKREVAQNLVKIWVRVAAHHVEDDIRLGLAVWVNPRLAPTPPLRFLWPERFHGHILWWIKALPGGSHGLRLTRHNNAAAQQKDHCRLAQDELPYQRLKGAAIASFANG